jgi:hypothetical protein
MEKFELIVSVAAGLFTIIQPSLKSYQATHKKVKGKKLGKKKMKRRQ